MNIENIQLSRLENERGHTGNRLRMDLFHNFWGHSTQSVGEEYILFRPPPQYNFCFDLNSVNSQSLVCSEKTMFYLLTSEQPEPENFLSFPA